MLNAISLIGMPGSGKSTIGKRLANELGWEFVDLDLVILEKTGISHDKILAEEGRQALLDLENRFTLELQFEKIVFSPGGSLVYSPAAMDKAVKESVMLYLEVPLSEIVSRLGNNADNSRGIVDFKEKGFAGLFAERTPLFKQYARHTISGAGLTENEVFEAARQTLKKYEIF